MKNKLVFKNLIIMEYGILMFVLFLTDWIIAIFKNGTFTVFGIIVNGIEAYAAAKCFEYLEDYYNQNKSQNHE